MHRMRQWAPPRSHTARRARTRTKSIVRAASSAVRTACASWKVLWRRRPHPAVSPPGLKPSLILSGTFFDTPHRTRPGRTPRHPSSCTPHPADAPLNTPHHTPRPYRTQPSLFPCALERSLPIRSTPCGDSGATTPCSNRGLELCVLPAPPVAAQTPATTLALACRLAGVNIVCRPG